MSLKLKVNGLGHLVRTCPIGNIEAKKCVKCDYVGSIKTFLGTPRLVICCYSGLEGRDFNKKYLDKRFSKI